MPIIWFPGTSFVTNGTMFTLLLVVLYHMYMWIHLQTDAIVHTLIARQGDIFETGFIMNHTPSTTISCFKNLAHNTWNAVTAHSAHSPPIWNWSLTNIYLSYFEMIYICIYAFRCALCTKLYACSHTYYVLQSETHKFSQNGEHAYLFIHKPCICKEMMS